MKVAVEVFDWSSGVKSKVIYGKKVYWKSSFWGGRDGDFILGPCVDVKFRRELRLGL